MTNYVAKADTRSRLLKMYIENALRAIRLQYFTQFFSESSLCFDHALTTRRMDTGERELRAVPSEWFRRSWTA